MTDQIVTCLIGVLGSALVAIIGIVCKALLKRVDTYIEAKLTPDNADKAKRLLDNVNTMVQTVVQDANNRMVIELKQKGAFTPEVANAVKDSVIEDVMKNLGVLKDEAATLAIPLENVVSKMIEESILNNKVQVNSLVGTNPPVSNEQLPGQTA